MISNILHLLISLNLCQVGIMFPYCFLFTDKFAVLPRLLLLLGSSGLEAFLVGQVYLHLGLQNLDHTEEVSTRLDNVVLSHSQI